jgi:TPR repeat protein
MSLNNEDQKLAIVGIFDRWTQKAPDEASEWCRRAAEQGFVRMEYFLGECYYYGRGNIPKDAGKAFEWFLKAAKQGDSDAQYYVGFSYTNGNGVEKDKTKAFEWYLKAAEQGHRDAQYYVGVSYTNGNGVEKDKTKAFEWYLKAAEQGHREAQFKVGAYYDRGWDVDKDKTKAFEWYLKAAEQGHRDAQHNVGVLYAKGKGVEKNKTKAFEWYLKAAEQGDFNSQYQVAFDLASGTGVMAKNIDEAARWLKRIEDERISREASEKGDAEWLKNAYQIKLEKSGLFGGSSGTIFYKGTANGAYTEHNDSWIGNISGDILWKSDDGQVDRQFFANELIITESNIEFTEVVTKSEATNFRVFMLCLLIDMQRVQDNLLRNSASSEMAMTSFFKARPGLLAIVTQSALAVFCLLGLAILLFVRFGRAFRAKYPTAWLLLMLAGAGALVEGFLLMVSLGIGITFGVKAGVSCAATVLLLGIAAGGMVAGPGRLKKGWRFLKTAKGCCVAFLILALPVFSWFYSSGLLWALNTLLVFMPFMIIGFLAQLGSTHKWARVASVIWLTLTLFTVAVVGGVMTIHALDSNGNLKHFFGMTYRVETLMIVAGMVLALCAALLPLFSSFRRLCGKLCGRDKWTGVQRIGLSAVISLTCIFLVPLLVLGEPPMLIDVNSFANGMNVLTMYMLTLFQMIAFLAIAAIAVGYGVTRNRSEVMARLGLVRPTPQQWKLMVIYTVLLLGASFFMEWGIDRLWSAMSWPKTDFEAFMESMKLLNTPFGAVVIGVSAGLGEEVAIRGVLQPRLGIILPNLLFTALHGLQYGWDGLLSVFLIGCVLGLIRKRTNTTTVVVVHGAYNFIAVICSNL